MTQNSEDIFFARLSLLQRKYTRSLTSRLSPYGIQPGYLTILQALWKTDGITQKELTRLVGLEQATLSNSLRRMERDHLISREGSKKDKRICHIFLSQKGHDVERTVRNALDDLNSVVNKGLSFNDLRYFNRILKHMTQQLQDDQQDSCMVLYDEIHE